MKEILAVGDLVTVAGEERLFYVVDLLDTGEVEVLDCDGELRMVKGKALSLYETPLPAVGWHVAREREGLSRDEDRWPLVVKYDPDNYLDKVEAGDSYYPIIYLDFLYTLDIAEVSDEQSPDDSGINEARA